MQAQVVRRTVILVGCLAALALAGRTAQRASASEAPRTSSARIMLGRVHYNGGGDWYANPSSLKNLIRAVAERTSLPIDREERTVTFRDPKLMDYQYLYITGHGTITMEPDEIVRLRSYLLRGGFLHVDDNYGLDSSFRIVVKQLFPERPLVDVPLNHPIYRVVYPFPRGVPKIHEHDGDAARGMGIFIGDRLALYYTFSADLGNGWEDVGTYPTDPPQLHEQALRMGVNLVTYAVTSRVQP
jgi:Domain of unknown function (DUF4159)